MNTTFIFFLGMTNKSLEQISTYTSCQYIKSLGKLEMWRSETPFFSVVGGGSVHFSVGGGVLFIFFLNAGGQKSSGAPSLHPIIFNGIGLTVNQIFIKLILWKDCIWADKIRTMGDKYGYLKSSITSQVFAKLIIILPYNQEICKFFSYKFLLYS